jgi:hypothetical protein
MNEEEKRDRQMLELLNELRVALPGVQILFAFLLAVPFQQGWQRVNDTQYALGMTAAIFLITDIIFRWTATLVVTGAIACAFAWFWYALPLRRRVERR